MADYVLDDRYTLIERIATGGMGEVWRGSDQILGRPVAIKMLAAAHAGDEQFRARFRAEARYASSLAHPGITRVFDYGEQSPLGGPYLVMELVDGHSLSEIIERHGRLDPYVTLDIVAQSARALDAAHRAGIVHRDIKPGNLLIMADGTTKITDFGIAKARVQSVNLTQTGLVMGTALYVSPEQATGQSVAGSSDVYSLGVVAYECLAGEPPFMAEQPLAIAIMHKHDPVPPLPDDVPRPIADLVYAMLAKNPEDRPKSARHVAERADVIRDARNRNGNVYTATSTSDLPVAAGAAAPTSMDLYQGPTQHQSAPERLPAPRSPGNRAFLVAGTGAAAVGVVAIIAVLISSNSHSAATVGSNTTLPTQTSSQSASHKTTAHTGGVQATSNVGNAGSGKNIVAVPTGGASPVTSLKTVSTSKSVSPTKSVTPTTHAPTTSAPTTHPPTTSAPTTHPPTTSAPTTSAPTTPAPTTPAPTTPAPTSATKSNAPAK